MTSTHLRIFVVLLLVAFLAGPALADIVYLKNGKKWEGKIVSENKKEVKIKTVGGVLTFKRSEIDRVEKKKTKGDEYKERRAKIKSDDIPALLELARWCEEQRLVVQKKKLYRALTKKVPNHPQIRRAMGQVYLDGEWKKMPKNFEPPVVSSGETKKFEKLLASLTLPKDWNISASEKGATATGPDIYATAPVLAVGFREAKPELLKEDGWPEKDGWEKAVEAKAGGMTGMRSRRTSVTDQIESVELMAVFPRATFRLTVLAIEEKTYAPALELAMKTLKFEAPPADYTNKRYKYQLNFPKGEGWTAGQTDGNDFIVRHVGEQVEEFAHMEVVTGDGDDYEKVKKGFDTRIAYIKKMGDINKDEEITVGGQKGRLIDGTFLSGGFPNRRRIIGLEYNKRFYVVMLTQHEYGCDRTDIVWTKLLESFRFLD